MYCFDNLNTDQLKIAIYFYREAIVTIWSKMFALNSYIIHKTQIKNQSFFKESNALVFKDSGKPGLDI